MYLEWGRGKVVKRNKKYHIHKGYVFSLKHVFLSFSILMRSRRSGGMKKAQKLNLGPGLRDPENKPTGRSLRHSWTSCLTPMEPRRKNRGQLNLHRCLKQRKTESPASLSQTFSDWKKTERSQRAKLLVEDRINGDPTRKSRNPKLQSPLKMFWLSSSFWKIATLREALQKLNICICLNVGPRIDFNQFHLFLWFL